MCPTRTKIRAVNIAARETSMRVRESMAAHAVRVRTRLRSNFPGGDVERTRWRANDDGGSNTADDPSRLPFHSSCCARQKASCWRMSRANTCHDTLVQIRRQDSAMVARIRSDRDPEKDFQGMGYAIGTVPCCNRPCRGPSSPAQRICPA
jgi:hypothetical protein